MQPKVAVVEDEEALSVLLRYNLESEATKSKPFCGVTKPKSGYRNVFRTF